MIDTKKLRLTQKDTWIISKDTWIDKKDAWIQVTLELQLYTWNNHNKGTYSNTLGLLSD